jgi:hypothetical protein
MSHPDHVTGWPGTLEELAKAIGDMRYDTQARLIGLLVNELKQQSRDDWHRDRRQLSMRLLQAAHDLGIVQHDMQVAWSICEPHMTEP